MAFQINVRGVVRQKLEVTADDLVGALRARIMDIAALDAATHSLRLIAGGKKMLDDDRPLSSYRVRKGSTVLAQAVEGGGPGGAEEASAKAMAAEEAERARVDRIRKGVDVLGSKEAERAASGGGSGGGGGGGSFELENQDGQVYQLPAKDRAALMKGMMLHEKGKALLAEGKDSYRSALTLLLEAEEQMCRCSPRWLSAVDNYAFLCLDVVWTYFLLRDLSNLDLAERCLQRARDGFARAHGVDMERLVAMKGPLAPERALYVRLHLLMGVVAFHRGSKAEATRWLLSARSGAAAMRFTDEQLAPLIAMGFEDREARRALRAAGGDLAAAATAAMEAREARRRKAAQRKLGKTVAGAYISLEAVEALEASGFLRELIVEGLKQTNNDRAATVALLTESPDVLWASITAAAEAKAARKAAKAAGVSKTGDALLPDVALKDEDVAMLMSLGFDRTRVEAMLRSKGGDADAAMHALMSGEDAAAAAPADLAGALDAALAALDKGDGDGDGDGADDDAAVAAALALEEVKVEESDAELAARLAAEEAAAAAAAEEAAREAARKAEEEAAVEEVLDGFDDDEEAHLDVDLDVEVAAIEEYMELCSE